jgi:hypothetical protein
MAGQIENIEKWFELGYISRYLLKNIFISIPNNKEAKFSVIFFRPAHSILAQLPGPLALPLYVLPYAAGRKPRSAVLKRCYVVLKCSVSYLSRSY